MKYAFQATYKNTVVANGEATAVMLSEFQRSFKEGIGPIQQLDGDIPKLATILDMPRGSMIHWRALDVSDQWHSFNIIRSHE